MPTRVGQKICIVDDDDAVRDSMKLMLESHGWEVQDFASARALLDADGWADCRCLVLDFCMPAMSGLELLETLRAQNVRTPAIMVTAEPQMCSVTRLANLGLFALLPKPVDDVALINQISGAIRTSIH